MNNFRNFSRRSFLFKREEADRRISLNELKKKEQEEEQEQVFCQRSQQSQFPPLENTGKHSRFTIAGATA